MPTTQKKTSRSATGAKKKRATTASSRTTTDHEEIRQWAEDRQGEPACVRGTGGRGDTGVLRIDFPGGEEEKLQKITWDEWFEKFDERGLEFLYQEKTAAGKTSRFNKIVSRETAEGKSTKAKRSSGKTRTAGR